MRFTTRVAGLDRSHAEGAEGTCEQEASGCNLLEYCHLSLAERQYLGVPAPRRISEFADRQCDVNADGCQTLLNGKCSVRAFPGAWSGAGQVGDRAPFPMSGCDTKTALVQ